MLISLSDSRSLAVVSPEQYNTPWSRCQTPCILLLSHKWFHSQDFLSTWDGLWKPSHHGHIPANRKEERGSTFCPVMEVSWKLH